MKRIKNYTICSKHLLPAIGLIAITNITFAEEITHRIDADIFAGYDDNPFKLAESLNVYESYFYQLNLQLTNRRNETGVYYRFKANTIEYQDQESSDAGVDTFNAELGFRWRPEFNDLKADYTFSIDVNTKDSTYYLRNTGNIATFGGEVIGDRYDANWFDIRGRGKYPFSKLTALTFDIRWRNKSYEDYTAIGLSNLDYSELQFQGGFDLKFDNSWRWQPSLEWRGRYFDNKRIPDLQGDLIEDTDLKFSYLRLINDFYVDVSDSIDIKVGYDIKQREDNGQGYYDNTENNANVRIRYREKPHELAFYIAYVDRSFDNQTSDASAELEEENKSKQGFNVRLKYEYSLEEIITNNMKLVFEMEYGDYDNSDPFYVYERNQAYVGFESRF